MSLATTQPPPASQFLPRLRRKIAEVGNGLCVGIDPPLDGLPPFFRDELAKRGARDYLETYAAVLIEATAGIAPAVKFQSAYFEAHGAPGFEALEAAIAKARSRGLVTILDAKRGDIASTMAAYGVMAFERMQADALTITPYMGMDVVEPLIPWLKAGHGVYVVWVSSNPSGALLQDTVAEPLLDALIAFFGERGIKEALGLVLGATKVESLRPEILAKLGTTSLLMPGVGAQGGTVTSRIKALIAGSGAVLVPLSRGVGELPAHCNSWQSYRETVETRMKRVAADVASPGS